MKQMAIVMVLMATMLSVLAAYAQEAPAVEEIPVLRMEGDTAFALEPVHYTLAGAAYDGTEARIEIAFGPEEEGLYIVPALSFDGDWEANLGQDTALERRLGEDNLRAVGSYLEVHKITDGEGQVLYDPGDPEGKAIELTGTGSEEQEAFVARLPEGNSPEVLRFEVAVGIKEEPGEDYARWGAFLVEVTQ